LNIYINREEDPVTEETIPRTTWRRLDEINLRGREAATAALVGRVFAKAGIEVTQNDYPSLLPCELRELLKLWIKVAVEIDYYRFLTGNIDGCDTRCRFLAWERIEAIKKLLGLDEVEDVLEEVRQEVGKFENPRYWTQEEARRLGHTRNDRELA
jgi:hypothetical protein